MRSSLVGFFTIYLSAKRVFILKGCFLDSHCKCNIFMENMLMTIYYHLSPEERAVIMIERNNHSSIRKIARTLNRSASTISRELKRNSVATKSTYCARSARQKYETRREICVKPMKMAVGSYLYNLVKGCLLEKQ